MINLKKLWPLILITAIVTINTEQAGVAVGWSSSVMFMLLSEDSPIPTTPEEGSWITTIVALSSCLFTIAASLSMHYLGRKTTIGITVIPYLISWIMISIATTTTELLIARIIAGIGLTSSYVVTPVYLGEISPTNIRGITGIFMSVLFYVGVLKIYCIGNVMSLWLSSLISALPLLLLIVFYKWIPETPYYLLKKNSKIKAKASLKLLRNSKNVEDELKQIELSTAECNQKSSFKELLYESSHKRALMICLGVVTFAQCSGGVTFLFYAHIIFQKAGNVSVNLMAIIKAILQLLCSVIAAYIVENTGKVPLLLLSCVGSAVFMFCEGIYFFLHDYGYNVDSIWWLPLFSMVLFNMVQAIGIIPISYTYLGELFHPNIKSLAVCISKMYMTFLVFAVSKLYQTISDSLGNWVPFFIFAFISLLGVIFVKIFVPETKGKSLEDIQYYMKHKKYLDDTN